MQASAMTGTQPGETPGVALATANAGPRRPGRRRRLTARRGPVGGLVLRLVALRHELGLGEEAFARYLNISPSHWFRLRQGTGRPGAGLLARVMRERPDFATLIAGEFARR